MPPKKEHFSIHASVVFQLGENLITDSAQALLELIKNSYDADATFCKVSVNTAFPTLGGLGQILVEDDGTGMGHEAIKRGWLTIADSTKKEQKRLHLTTKKGRTPLGDKGLGRLGTQRLGSTLEIITRTGDNIERKVTIDWNEFTTGKLLELVDVGYEESATDSGSGTTLIISGLRDLETWKASERDKLRKTLSQVISPYKALRNFEVLVKVDGESVDLYELSAKLRETALISYRLSFEEDLLQTDGRVKLAYIRPDKGKKEKLLFDDLVSKDNGREFFAFLKTQKGEKEFNFKNLQGRWYAGFNAARALDDFDGLETVDGIVANPGPFTGEIDYFGLGSEASANQKVFSDASLYRELIGTLSGIRIFRDGFGIRVGHDWLQLGEQWTSAPSYYGLKPQNTMGYIAISALHNQCLQEKTDREGFIADPYYNNFREMLRWFVEFAGRAQEFLRRGWNEFKRVKAHQKVDLPEATTPEDVAISMASVLSRSANYRLSLSRASLNLTNSASNAERLRGLRNKTSLSGKEVAELNELSQEMEVAIINARKSIADVDSYLQELLLAEKHAEILSQQVEMLREQIKQTHEVIALGLTAEALSHEIGNIASGLADRNDQILKYLRGGGPRDAKLLSYAEHVKGVVTGLRRELSYLAPSLQYVREKREQIEVYELLADMYKHHLARFSSERISLRLRGDSDRNFIVKVNRGKLVQVFDNLLFNSEYWLKEDLRLKKIPQGIIDVEVKSPWVWVSDNGRGVDPAIEDHLFEPFVSAKGKGKGRGLGLFIVKQLLESENCSIHLLEERNKYDRKVKFELELRGILSD